jgi:phosphoglycolate phosphatase-like HAD superfamily hydrolase
MHIPRKTPPARAIRAEQTAILERALLVLRQTQNAVAAFDLDSTLFDNRPRQALILREFGQEHGDARLLRVEAHDVDGWDLRTALRSVGLSETEAEGLHVSLRQFWRPRFFSSPYCVEDVPLPGAVSFVEAVRACPARVVYVTGRDTKMRDGTIESLRRSGFPVPDQGETRLLMKPNPTMNDDHWKQQAHQQLRRLGTVAAAFDNEPSHINAYALAFPGAVSVHLDTDHSGRPVEVLSQVPSVAHFER